MRGVGEADTNNWGLGPNNIAYIFIFLVSIIMCWLYELTLSDQAQLICSYHSVQFSVKICSQSALATRPKKIFRPGPNLLLVALYHTAHITEQTIT